MSRTNEIVAVEVEGVVLIDPVPARLTAGRGGEGGGEGVFLTPPSSLFLTGAGNATAGVVVESEDAEEEFEGEEGTIPSSEMILAEQPNIPFQVAAIAIPTAHRSVSCFASSLENNFAETSKIVVIS
jgi:hypothetical protein